MALGDKVGSARRPIFRRCPLILKVIKLAPPSRGGNQTARRPRVTRPILETTDYRLFRSRGVIFEKNTRLERKFQSQLLLASFFSISNNWSFQVSFFWFNEIWFNEKVNKFQVSF